MPKTIDLPFSPEDVRTGRARTDLTQREQWAETEAVFCDLMVKTYLASAKEWHDKGVSLYGEENAKMAMECMIHAKAWNKVGHHLRQPYRARLENERTE